jgi:hypothetical protein
VGAKANKYKKLALLEIFANAAFEKTHRLERTQSALSNLWVLGTKNHEIG